MQYYLSTLLVKIIRASRLFSLLFISLFLVLSTAKANEVPKLTFDHFSVADGLSSGGVFSIAQDRHGFIWIATFEGLSRFDGKKFINYRHNDNENNSVADNLIRKVYIDKNNTLWVGTHNGLSRYNEATDSFENFHNIPNQNNSLYDNVILDIYQDNDDNLIISTDNGLQTYNPKSNDFTRIKFIRTAHKIKEIKTIAQDKQGNYWLGTFGDGIYLSKPKFKKITSLKSPQANDNWSLNINANILYSFSEIENNYWLATDNGLYIISNNYQIKQHITTESSNGLLLSNEVRSIKQINDKHVWLATRYGLNQIDIDTDEISSLVSKHEHNTTFIEHWLTSIFLDFSGQAWLGTHGQGLYIHNPASTIFNNPLGKAEHMRLISFSEFQNDNNVWSNNELGELFYTENNKTKKVSGLAHIDVAKIVEFENFLILNTYDNLLFQYFPATGQLTEVNDWQKESNYDWYKQLYNVDNSLCYLSKSKKLRCYHFENKDFSEISVDNTANLSLIGTSTNEVIAISNNDIFTSKKTSLEFVKSYQIEDENIQIRQITSTNKWIWFSTKKHTIHLINKGTQELIIFSSKNGLAGTEITSIVADEQENLWLATNGGITLIQPDNLTVKHFSSEYGLDNAEFMGNSFLKLKNGDILFGTVLGYYQFSPQAAISSTALLHNLSFTQLQIKNDKFRSAKNTVKPDNNEIKAQFQLDNAILKANNLTIAYNQFPLTFEFISPNSNLADQISYSYRLIGSDTSWLNANNHYPRATYTTLSPGEYVLEARAIDIYDPNNISTKRLNITVTPPWWLSVGAQFIYGLTFALFCLYVFLQMRHKQQYHLQIKASEERLKLSLWGSGDEMWDWNITTGKIFRSNIWGTLDFPQDGKRNVGTEHTNIHPYDIPRVKATLNAHFDQKTEHFEATYRVKSQTDNWMWVLDRGKIVERDDKGSPTRMTGTLKDISQIKKAEERLKLFAKCIENISDAVIIYDRQFSVVDVNKAYESITARSREQILGTPFQFALYPESFTQGVKKHLITHGSWRGEIENKRPNGELYFTDLSLDVIRDESDNISHFVAVFSDVTSRKDTEAELRKLANSDTLTGLPNRSFFQANQHQLVTNKTPHALLVFDLDNFKKINDSMGHQVGDMLLIAVAKRLVKLSNNKNIVYRLGGDEFSIILENTNDIHTITSVAKHILSAIAQPLKIKNQEIVLYSSIGIVLYPEDGATPQELLKNADTAMYHAKGSGGNKYQFFSDSMNKQAVKRLQVESLIRHGLKDDLFSVFYQPKIEISTGKIAGMEALVRFETPTKGIISPLVFIPVSEETGQIIDIGEIVLRKSCFATKKWVDAGMFDGRIAVNLSAVQFTQPNLVNVISNILEESGLAPKYLELEITEGTVMDSPQRAIDTMLQIRAMGIHLSLDDFGTGYSSLAYLKKFPLNTLKIDKAFVDDIEVSEQGRNMVATIVTIAHNLGLHVVAEGVENNNQLNFLAGLECEQLQGYLYSKPLAEPEFQKYLLSHQITDQSTLSITGRR